MSENNLVVHVLNASKKDSVGDWDSAVCNLVFAEKEHKKISVLETKCDTDISEFVNENAFVSVCDIENDRGIGEWAIRPSLRNCNVFRIRGGQLPPPYGEFVQEEFVAQEVTEVQTS